jgi:hypothetical protein
MEICAVVRVEKELVVDLGGKRRRAAQRDRLSALD